MKTGTYPSGEWVSGALPCLIALTLFVWAGACTTSPSNGHVTPADALGSGYQPGSPEALALDGLMRSATPAGAGWSVSADARGTTFLRSLPYGRMPDIDGTLGLAFLFEESGDGPSATFVEFATVDLLYGGSTAMSADGSLVIIGAPGSRGSDHSYVFGYLRQGDRWAGQDGLAIPWFQFPAQGAGWFFGIDADVSGDSGATVLVGAPGALGSGRAFYYIPPPTGWGDVTPQNLQTGSLGAGDGAPGDGFGRSVAISRDDSTIVIGAPGKNDGAGQIYIFQKPAGGWLETRCHFPLAIADGQAGDAFGHSLGISNDGSVIAVGAPGARGGVGAAYCVVLADPAAKTLDPEIHELEPNPYHSHAGVQVAVSGDGRTIAVGGFGMEHCGEVRVYGTSSGWWDDAHLLDQWFGTPDRDTQRMSMLGYSLDLTDDGRSLFVGAPLYSGGTGNTIWFETSR